MKCKECNDETNQIKAGKTKAGTQKYKCKICGKYYVLEGKKREYSEEIKKQAIKLDLGEYPMRFDREFCCSKFIGSQSVVTAFSGYVAFRFTRK